MSSVYNADPFKNTGPVLGTIIVERLGHGMSQCLHSSVPWFHTFSSCTGRAVAVCGAIFAMAPDLRHSDQQGHAICADLEDDAMDQDESEAAIGDGPQLRHDEVQVQFRRRARLSHWLQVSTMISHV